MAKTWTLQITNDDGSVVETFNLDDYSKIELIASDTPDPDPQPRPRAKYRVLASGLNVRSEPGGNDIGDLFAGQEAVFYTDEQPDKNGWLWRQIAEFEKVPSYEGAWCAERSSSSGGAVYLKLVEDIPTPDPDPGPQPNSEVKFFSAQDSYGKYSLIDWDNTGTARPIGVVNIRSWFHWEAMQYTKPARRGEYLNLLKNIGVRAIRCYLPHKDVGIDDTIARAKSLLDQAQAAGMKLWVVLTDSIGEHLFHLKENEQWHSGPLGHLTNDYYAGKHYRQHYMPFVEKFLNALGEHPALLLVEDANEPSSVYTTAGSTGDPQAYFDFLKEFSAKVKSIAPGLPVAMGCINLQHLWPGASLEKKIELLNALPNVDILTGHMYSEDVTDRFAKWPKEDQCHSDMLAARQANHPMVYMVGEYGASSFKFPDWRSFANQKFMERWITKRNAQGCAAWGFMFESYDVGIGDHQYGVDSVPSMNGKWFDHDKQRYTQFNNEVYPLKELPASPKV
ncbi:hypothetical protein GF380_03225 [Candidatus Uhrbacteria bacterium]|nr:hypothetical protein [Candidatus Uhrbacteria bacterium]